MILLDLIDVLAIAARVSDEETEAVLARADLDAIDEALAASSSAAATSDCAAAAGALLAELVARRPFPERNRRIAMTVALHLFATNGQRLDLGSSRAVDQLLDELAVGMLGPADAARWFRLRFEDRPAAPGSPTSPSSTASTASPAGAASAASAAESVRRTEKAADGPSFERFTARARRVLALARDAAKEFRHPAVDTQHILLGLLDERDGVAAKALRSFALSAEQVRAQIEVLLGRGREPTLDDVPFTPRAERLLELASVAADRLGHTHVGTEHLLLGLIQEGEGLPAKLLARLGIDPAEIDLRVFRVLAGHELKQTQAGEQAEWRGGLSMFERFTDRARRVVVLAQEEARMLSHNYIGTEHVLLGLVHEGEGIAAKALTGLGISLEAVRASVEEIIGQGQQDPGGHIPFTPRAKKVMELSLREAMQLGHNYIGTEHLLLGLIREGKGVAAQVLVKLGADLDATRQRVRELLGAPSGGGGRSGKWSSLEEEWFGLRESWSGAEESPAPSLSGLRRRRILRDIEELYDVVERLRLENVRLRGLLREQGVDPDEASDISPEDDDGPDD